VNQLKFHTSFALLTASLAVVLLLGRSDALAQATAPVLTASVQTTCKVDQSSPSEGELALAKKDYATAETFFRAAIKTDSASEDAHLGLVRALIGKNDVTGARTEADAMLAQHPHSAIAEVAVAEADFRAADFDGSTQHVVRGVTDDNCEGRAAAAAAHIWGVNAFFAREAQYIQQAHRLRPNDELIRREWIDTLPRKERAIELPSTSARRTLFPTKTVSASATPRSI
jgi:Tetratricopeptide repeat